MLAARCLRLDAVARLQTRRQTGQPRRRGQIRGREIHPGATQRPHRADRSSRARRTWSARSRWITTGCCRTSTACRSAAVEDGTAIGSAIAAGVNRLRDQPAKSKVIVLLTDGQNNTGKISPLTAAQAARALGISVYTIGIGVRGEAPMPGHRRVRQSADRHGRRSMSMKARCSRSPRPPAGNSIAPPTPRRCARIYARYRSAGKDHAHPEVV